MVLFQVSGESNLYVMDQFSVIEQIQRETKYKLICDLLLQHLGHVPSYEEFGEVICYQIEGRHDAFGIAFREQKLGTVEIDFGFNASNFNNTFKLTFHPYHAPYNKISNP